MFYLLLCYNTAAICISIMHSTTCKSHALKPDLNCMLKCKVNANCPWSHPAQFHIYVAGRHGQPLFLLHNPQMELGGTNTDGVGTGYMYVRLHLAIYCKCAQWSACMAHTSHHLTHTYMYSTGMHIHYYKSILRIMCAWNNITY